MQALPAHIAAAGELPRRGQRSLGASLLPCLQEGFHICVHFEKAHNDSSAFLHGCQSVKNAGNLLVKATIFKRILKVCQFSIDNRLGFAYIVLST